MSKDSTIMGNDLSSIDRPHPDGAVRPAVPPLPPQRTERLGRGGLSGVVRFVQESQVELRKVTWPSREQTINLTVVVIAVCLIIAVGIGAVDYVFQWLVRQLIIP